jgi:SagB-type dehydrogenase family enzyme
MTIDRAPTREANKRELQQLIDLLSDEECAWLLGAVRDVAEGERFWEGDSGIFYNEFVKQRYFRMPRRAQSVPAAAGTEHDFVPLHVVKSYSGASRVELPAPEPLSAPMTDVLMGRRSRRDYSGTAISLAEFSSLLQHGCGVTGFVSAYGYSRLPLRSFPSHGGLQSPEVYVSIQAVEEIPPGIYHYHPVDHVLESLRPGDHRERLYSLAFNETHIRMASVVLLITGCYGRLRWKYGERAYRFICLDAGFVGENFYLVAEALGLGTCAVSGFAQDAAEELLGVDGKEEMALFLLSVGVRSEIGRDTTRVEDRAT